MDITLKLNDQAVREDEDLKKFAALLQQLLNRMSMSHFKYGPMRDKYPHSARAIDNAEERLKMYKKQHNTENLLDAANFLLIEALFPSQEGAYFEAQTAAQSPGIVYRED